MNVVDLFAGGGGASEGIRQALGVAPAVAVNHDEAAIRMHAAKREQVARIGNSVCPPVARAIVAAQFGGSSAAEQREVA